MTSFPLYERARAHGLLDGASALIVAPTATGKSRIGRDALLNAVRDAEDGLHVYLVPYRALAGEIGYEFQRALGDTDARVRILAGDRHDPRRPQSTELLVATYESFAGLVRGGRVCIGRVVADEVHLLADEHRGPVVEGLLAELTAPGRVRALLGLSAVIENADRLADWLGVPLVEGTVADRPVDLKLRDEVAGDLDGELARLLLPCQDGQQALVFCSSRTGAERVAKELAERLDRTVPGSLRRRLHEVARRASDEDGAADRLTELLPSAVAYHHAGLIRPVRERIEAAFRERLVRVITCTPTLAAGVNLPADLTVVRDIFRSERVRGGYREVLIPSGEVLNMLGRAGRPALVEAGTGIVLVEREYDGAPEVEQLVESVRAGRGSAVASRLPARFESVMRFVLDVVVAHGETTPGELAAAFQRTFAYYTDPAPVTFDREFREDLMEDIPAYDKVRKAGAAMGLVSSTLTPEGVQATVRSKDKWYQLTLAVTGIGCDCPAGSRWSRDKVCKHQALAIHDLLFGDDVDEETRTRAKYLCGQVFGATLDIGTRLDQAVLILEQWRLVERAPAAWRATPLGEVASASWFDLLLIRQVADRVRGANATSYRELAQFAVDDFHADVRKRSRWAAAVDQWLDEESERAITLPTRYRGDFEQGLEQLALVCGLYEQVARSEGNERLAGLAHDAGGALRYGVAPEVVPLRALGFRQLSRTRARYLYDRGVRTVADLAVADPETLADQRRAPLAYLREWIERARQVYDARAVEVADRDEDLAELDELVARFGLDPAALG